MMSPTSRLNHGERICSFTASSGLAVPAELDVGAEHGVLPFLDHAGEVRVHENVGIQVI